MKDRLETAESSRTVSAGDWKYLAGDLSQDLDEAARRAWMEKLHQMRATPEALASASPSDVVDLSDAIDSLVDKEGHRTLAAWMTANSTWQTLDSMHLASGTLPGERV